MSQDWEGLMGQLMGEGGGRKKFSAEDLVESLPELSDSVKRAKLMKFIFEACGGQSNVLSEKDLLDFQNSKKYIFKSIYAAAKGRKTSDKYPILKKRFFERFVDFLLAFVIKSGKEFFAVDNGFQDFESFLEILMVNTHTHYRHTATLTYLKIVTAGAQIGYILKKDINYLKEGTLDEDDDRDPVVKILLADLTENYDHLTAVLKNMTKKLSDRLRDVSSDVTLLCLKEAEAWCKGSIFFGLAAFEEYLSFTLLNNKRPSVRQQALRVAIDLFENLSNQDTSVIISALKLLKVIIPALDMNTMDTDENNAVLAVAVFVQALKYRECYDIVPSETRLKLLSLVCSKRSLVSIEAGAVLKEIVEHRTLDDKRRLREVLKISAERIGNECFIFWGLQRAQCDWFMDCFQSMKDLLLGDNEELLSQNERISAIALFGFLVQYLATEEMPLRQRIHEENVLQNLLPLPRDNVNLKPLPPHVSAAYIDILQASATNEERAYVVRLVQFMNSNDSFNEQQLLVLIAWMEQACNETEYFVLLEEISRALATLRRLSATGSTGPLHSDHLCNNAVDKVMSFLAVENYRVEVPQDESLTVFLKGLKETAALLAHDQFSNLKDSKTLGWLSDLSDLLKTFIRNDFETTSVKIEVMETCFKVYQHYLTRLYDAIPRDAWSSIPLISDCKNIRVNATTCIIIGNLLVLGKDSAIGQKIYPVMCDVLTDMPRIDVTKRNLQIFVTASKFILKKVVFYSDENGDFSEERVELGLKILCPFARVIWSGVIPITEIPFVFHHYNKCCSSYDEVLRDIIVNRKEMGDEWNVILAILKSIHEVYVEDGREGAEVLSEKLSRIFGYPEKRDTQIAFHIMILLISLKINPSGWNKRSRGFVAAVAKPFHELMRGPPVEQLFQYLVTNIPEIQTVSSVCNTQVYICEYVHLVSNTRSGQ